MGWEPAMLFILGGMGLLLLPGLPRKQIPLTGFIALSFTAGIYLLTLLLMLVALLTGRFFFSLIWLLLVAGLAAIILRWNSIKQNLKVSLPATSPVQTGSMFPNILLFLLILAQGMMVFRLATLYPFVGFDAIGNYAMKAKMWYHTGLLFPPHLLDPEFIMFHRRYPPAIPLSEAAWSVILGGWSEIKIKYFFLFCWLFSGCLLYTHLRRKNSSLIAWLGLSFYFLLPYHIMEIQGGPTDAYPEIPFIMALLSAFILVKQFATKPNLASAAIMALFVAGTMLLKKEGLFFVILIIIYMLWIKAPSLNIFLIFISSALCYLMIVLSNLDIQSVLHERYVAVNLTPQLFVERIGILARFLVSEFFYKERWGNYFWYVFVLIWIYKSFILRWRELFTVDLFFCLGMGIFYLILLLNTHLDFYTHLDTTLHRLFLHIYPLFIIATFNNLLISKAQGLAPDSKVIPQTT